MIVPVLKYRNVVPQLIRYRFRSPYLCQVGGINQTEQFPQAIKIMLFILKLYRTLFLSRNFENMEIHQSVPTNSR